MLNPLANFDDERKMAQVVVAAVMFRIKLFDRRCRRLFAILRIEEEKQPNCVCRHSPQAAVFTRSFCCLHPPVVRDDGDDVCCCVSKKYLYFPTTVCSMDQYSICQKMVLSIIFKDRLT